MAEYRVYRSSRFNNKDPYDWELAVHRVDGAVTKANFESVFGEQIIEVCKVSLDVDDTIETIFLWHDNSWCGSVSRV